MKQNAKQHIFNKMHMNGRDKLKQYISAQTTDNMFEAGHLHDQNEKKYTKGIIFTISSKAILRSVCIITLSEEQQFQLC